MEKGIDSNASTGVYIFLPEYLTKGDYTMNKQAFFDAIRAFVNANAVEPHKGFVNNNLSIAIDDFIFAIEGRDAGIGYVTVRIQFMGDPALGGEIACELPKAHGGCFDEPNCAEALLAIVQHDYVDTQIGECPICKRTNACLKDDPQAHAFLDHDLFAEYQRIKNGERGFLSFNDGGVL